LYLCTRIRKKGSQRRYTFAHHLTTMPTNKNAMTRYKILDTLLSDRYHCYTLDSLTEIVGQRLEEIGQSPVTRRQIEKDLLYIETDLEGDIERYTADGEACFNKKLMKTVYRKGVRYSDPSFSIFKKKLSEDEKNLMRDLLSLVGQFDGLPELGAMEDMRQRLQLGEEKRCIALSKNPLDGTNTFGMLYSAISHKQVVELTYHTYRNANETKQIIVSPQLLKEYNRRWFLICIANADKKVLTFALDQLDTIAQCPTYKYKEYDGDLNERYEDIVGITYYENKPVEHIVFWVSDNSVNHVLTKPIHESQKHYTGDNESALRKQYKLLHNGVFCSIDCIVNYELIRELMSFGPELLVLEPATLTNEIGEKLYTHYKAYEKV